MKLFKLIIISLVIFGVSFSSVFSADEDSKDYRSFVDIVCEWTPYGNQIQVGDYTITKIRSVWLDNGEGPMVEVSSGSIHLGELARVILINEDENGFLDADKIVVFSGKGLEKAMNEISLIKRAALLKK